MYITGRTSIITNRRGRRSSSLATTIITLLNYIQTTDPGELAQNRQLEEDDYTQYISKHVNQHDYRFHAVFMLVESLFDDMLNTLPVYNRQAARELLEAYGLDFVLAKALLGLNKGSVTRLAGMNLTPDLRQKILDKIIEDRIEILKESPDLYQQNLEAKDFTTDRFSYQEVEVDNAGTRAGDTSLEKRTVRLQGNSRYGESISIQGKRFTILRDGDTITVNCSGWKGPLWKATFPVKVSVGQIATFGNTPELDFRQAGALLEELSLQAG